MTTFANRSYTVDRAQFCGTIEPDDFNTHRPNKRRIQNQADAFRSSNQGKDQEAYRHMTLDELRKRKIISNGDARPSPALTDETWQKEFQIRKRFVLPCGPQTRWLKGAWNAETQGAYLGPTNWQEYCAYINDILRNIRSGQVDYCYYIYQILDLLKFHYHDLRTRYRDGYWEVWLEK